MSSAVEKIHEFRRFGSVLGLERMNDVLSRLGDPQDDLKVIHVAGTNGKGSVCKFLEGGLSSCGYNVGLYTSPYIESFNERIRLGGQDISDSELEVYTDRVLDKVKEMVSDGKDSPTEFEVITAVALLYFKEKNADIVILEVGLGGSGDSTNVIREPLASVICSISYDHMDRLGNTLEEIAADKAGIIKPGCPVISNVPQHGPAAVIARKAYENDSRLYDVSGIKFNIHDETPFSQKVTMELYGTDYSDVEISMVGRHQGENLRTALAVIEVLRKAGKIKVERGRLYDGLKTAVQPGRFEILSQDPFIIADGAHNEAGAAALQETMAKYFQGSRVLLVTGVLADKQVDEIMRHFADITHDVIVTEPGNPRKLSAEKLAEHFRSLGINAVTAKTPQESLKLACQMQENHDAVLFAGSLYLIGEIRRLLKNGRKQQTR